jgi:cysteinyl-tRNA synthetase
MLSLPSDDGAEPASQDELEAEAVAETIASEEGEGPAGLERSTQKMAHSGSFVTITSVLAAGDIPPMALRTYLLGQQYRANLLYSEEQLRASVVRWRRWAETAANLRRLMTWAATEQSSVDTTCDPNTLKRLAAARAEFIAAMDDDLNTSRALSVIDELAHRINDATSGLRAETLIPTTAPTLKASLDTLIELAGVLGIALDEATGGALASEQRAEIEELVRQRDEARKAKNWAESDRIRKALDERYHVTVKDTPQGAVWSVKE